MQTRNLAVVTALLLLASPTARAELAPRSPLGNLIVPGVLGDIVYRRAGDVELALDASKQGPGESGPGVIVVHGGGWGSGSRDARVGQLLELLTSAGYRWVSIDYRLGGIARHADALDDLRSALAFVREHARDLRMDPERLAVLGEDAGADLALLLAREAPAGVKAVVAIGASYDATALPGLVPAHGAPPMLVLHGAEDRESPPSRAEAYRDASRAAGNDCQLLLVDDAIHAVESWRPECWSYKPRLSAWLAQRLGHTVGEARPQGGPLRKDIRFRAYEEDGRRADLRLDAFIPEGQGPFAAVIVVHGGGWEAGDKVTYVTPLFAPLAQAGFAWFSIDYRLTPRHRHEAQLDDVRRAVRFVRYHARDFRVDPDRIALLGESASGQMVLQVAATPDRGDPRAPDPIDSQSSAVRAAVSFYGVYDLEATSSDAGPLSIPRRLFGVTELDAAARETMRRYSPLHTLTGASGTPPILLVHGTNERLWEQALALERRLVELGAAHDLIRLDGAPHGLESWEGHPEWQGYKQRLVDWLRRSLSAPSPPPLAGFPVDLPPLPAEFASPPPRDWLLDETPRSSVVAAGSRADAVVLTNGLVRRVFRLRPNGVTIGLDDLRTGTSFLRGLKPEATVTIDGRAYDVGGLAGQPEYAYLLPEWVDAATADPKAFRLEAMSAGKPQAHVAWGRRRRSEDRPWPPPGAAIRFRYAAPEGPASGITVDVCHELYDGLPLLAKWIEVENGTARTITLDAFTSEMLALVEAESAVDERDPKDWRRPPVLAFSDYSFKGMDLTTANRTISWVPDPQYASQVHFNRQTPALLVSRPPLGPAARIEPGGRFTSFRTYVLLQDSDSRERQGLALRRSLRTIAPWVTENPIIMHVRSAETKAFRAAADQCADVGFEMVIYTFGSGLDMENEDPAYLARVKADVDYAHAKGIEVGAYSLFSSRSVGPDDDVISPATGKPGGAIFGSAPCLASRWGEEYLRKLRRFIDATGLDLLEHDGPYPGDVCASTRHPGHRGLDDSQWAQWRAAADFYGWCRERGVYLNLPDYYFLVGSSKVAMGYRESNWSLPRDRQVILARQNIFDGTWEKTPSMGWMFVPLVEYQGGGPAATLEPLREHLGDYEAHLRQLFGAGVQACWRGPRLYDAPETRDLVARWVAWFKAHRDILESDVIHLRRADGRDWDGLLHVNSRLQERGLAVLSNPLREPIRRTVRLPLALTGLTDTARVSEQGGPAREVRLERDFTASVPVEIPAGGFTWLLVE